MKTLTVRAFVEKLLIATIKARSNNIIKEIINASIDLNGWDSSRSSTPLYYVVKASNAKLVNLLIDRGVDVNA